MYQVYIIFNTNDTYTYQTAKLADCEAFLVNFVKNNPDARNFRYTIYEMKPIKHGLIGGKTQ